MYGRKGSQLTRLILSCAAVLSLIHTGQLHASTYIDFDDGASGSAIGGFYSGLGVTFSNDKWEGPLPSGQSGTPSSGIFLASDGPNQYKPDVDNPIIGTFSFPLSMVSILAVDVGAGGVQMNAFNAAVGGSLIGTDSHIGIGLGVGNYVTLSVVSSDIRRIELFQPIQGTSDGVFFDNLTFAAEPADTDNDGDVDTADLTTMFQNFTGAGGSGKTMMDGDTDMDGDVDTADLTLGFQHFTGAQAGLASVPEPSGWVLVVLGLVEFWPLLRRRRRKLAA